MFESNAFFQTIILSKNKIKQQRQNETTGTKVQQFQINNFKDQIQNSNDQQLT